MRDASENGKEKLKESQAEIEILKLQNKKLAEAFDSLDKKYDSLKLELELAQACHKEKCAEFDKLCFDYAKLQVKNEKFEKNMKNVLEIEKKNAVKEFAGKLEVKAIKLSELECYHICNLIDEILMEYERGGRK